MKLHDLTSPEGSTHRRKIVGRGIAGKGGKTAGRGTKGQKARRQIRASFEGGQLPLLQRIPKLKGFTNPFRVEYTPVNLDALAALGLSEITLETIDLHEVATPERAAALCERIAATGALETARERALDLIAGAKAMLPALEGRQRAALELVADGVVARYA